jgi:secreted PhoX family phosphatase
MPNSRRQFLRRSAVTVGFLGLSRFSIRTAQAALGEEGLKYGKLLPDPNRIFDLPAGFTYEIIGRAGDFMDDGLRMPGRTDGMGAFPGPGGSTILVRNHELEKDLTFAGPFGLQNELLDKVDSDLIYDPGQKIAPQIGGTTTVVYNPKTREVEKQFLSLAGTCRNCAGGQTPWNSWISCEENVDPAGTPEEPDNKNESSHGWAFEIPASTEMTLTKPQPIEAMGRFNHEAVCIDPRTGIVYLTEDRNDGLLYRFIPNKKEELLAGGKLQFLSVESGVTGAKKDFDTRNWEEDADGFPLLTLHNARWIDIDNVESPEDDLRKRGYQMGGTRFARGEGIWFGDGELYFACTNGGAKQWGQIFRYYPSPAEGTPEEAAKPGRIELFLEPNDKAVLHGADNLTIAPWGDVIFCEEGPRHARLQGITPNGGVYPIGSNEYNSKELAGACFSPDGTTLFVNIYEPGITLAVTGPWRI